ncbi:G protein-coupled receptor, rhodopsin-like family and Globin, structural domain and GPCR, rhodopsin-like, 7TM domain-containing protein [Strongyloides ratti]|uniref:G protein-coupled receptor, rhodopsin-like family and Globin, structural domain and GPCR, rhodopsin-like, 7TM domain-containing protein n=1 Tax=Strongyloides ratti TaxID=34506 RepID=A0A090MQ69_STRRB|nr:G protein-coupled receptor, rhodopsin-like family and Globin, structural domain and GPCR, rhodopsin-like, 7TM domain-containing protein [Strongyloides ratti]CEF60298.1 G protein-coupled receptor, rhodopsin-like family and Globin, structural domain and GPCR, rhodopsin-like, 7TM domain-containing protein [Strongyloides ratti]
MSSCNDDYISILPNWYPFLSIIISLCGLLGNFHTLIRSDQRKHKKLSRYVHGLCIFDVAILLLIVTNNASNYSYYNFFNFSKNINTVEDEFITNFDGIKYDNSTISNPIKNILSILFEPIKDVYVTASSWMLTVITAKRYLAVAKPFKERIRSKNNPIWICLLISLISIIVNVPRAIFENLNSSCLNLITGRSSIKLNDYTYVLYIIFARILIDLIFTCPFPPLLNILLTFKILHYRHNYLRRSINNTNFDSHKITTNENLMDYMPFRKSSNFRSLSKTSTTTLQLFGNERRLKNDSFKSQLFLTLLNGKFFICNAIHLITIFLRWTKNDIISDETLELLKEINIAAIILHSSTNWIMFAKFNTRSLNTKCIPDYQIFDNHEKKILTTMWSHIDASGMGKDLLITLIIDNPLLIRSLIHDTKDKKFYSREELEQMPKIQFVGSRIGCFIESMMTTLKNVNMSKNDFVKIRAELRHVGMIHYIERVKINSQDWFSIKRYLVRKMMKECECVVSTSKNTCSQSHSKIHNEQLLVANKFSSFLIHELKNGFVCETVRTSHANGMERGEGSCIGSGVIFSSTGNLLPHNSIGSTINSNKNLAKMSTASCSLPITNYNSCTIRKNNFYRQISQTSQCPHKMSTYKSSKKFIIGSRESLQSSRQSSIENTSTSPSSIEYLYSIKKRNNDEKDKDDKINDSIKDIDVNIMYV